MRKLFVLFFVCFSFQLHAQQAKQVQLLSSERLKGFGNSDIMRVIKPIFSHEGSTLSADSGNFNQAQNTFDAFGNVVITQPNGTNVYSDVLNYSGNTRLAVLTKNVRLVDQDAVLTTEYLTYNMGTRIGTYTGGGKIVNGNNVLTSKNGYYFANSRDSYFRYNVVVTTPEVIIKCDTLRYNTGTKIAYFYGPTNIANKKDKSNLYTENGEYNTETDVARFGKNNLYTDGTKSLKGDSLFYDKKAGYGRAVKNITFRDTSDNPIILKGDLGIYRQKDSSTLVTRNAYVVLITKDSAKVDSIWMTADTLFTKVIYKGDWKPITKEEVKEDDELDVFADSTAAGNFTALPSDEPAAPEVKEEPEQAEEKNPKKAQREQKREEKRKRKRDKSRNKQEEQTAPDTTLKNTVPALTDSVKTSKDSTISALATDSLEQKIPKDTLANAPKDTTKTRIVQAFHHVKIFKSDLQAKADSAYYSYADSTIRCYINPIIWTQGSQLSADTIYLQLKNNKLDNMLLETNGLIVNTENDSTRFNQIKGKTLTGIFQDNQLEVMYVDGNAESIYYTVEDSAYTGMNRSVSSRMKVLFEDKQLKDVYFIGKPEMTYYPIEKIPKETEILEGFMWKPKERPKSKEEIIPVLKKEPAKKTPPANVKK